MTIEAARAAGAFGESVTMTSRVLGALSIVFAQMVPKFLQSMLLQAFVIFDDSVTLPDFILLVLRMGLNVIAAGLAYVAGSDLHTVTRQGIVDNLKSWLFGAALAGPSIGAVWSGWSWWTPSSTWARVVESCSRAMDLAYIGTGSKMVVTSFFMLHIAKTIASGRISEAMHQLVGLVSTAMVTELFFLSTRNLFLGWDNSQDTMAVVNATMALAGHGFVSYFVTSSVRGAASMLACRRPGHVPKRRWNPQPFQGSIFTTWPVQAAVYLLLIMWFVTVFQTSPIMNFRAGLQRTVASAQMCDVVQHGVAGSALSTGGAGVCTTLLERFMMLLRLRMLK
jgi:hypothetical protein